MKSFPEYIKEQKGGLSDVKKSFLNDRSLEKAANELMKIVDQNESIWIEGSGGRGKDAYALRWLNAKTGEVENSVLFLVPGDADNAPKITDPREGFKQRFLYYLSLDSDRQMPEPLKDFIRKINGKLGDELKQKIEDAKQNS